MQQLLTVLHQARRAKQRLVLATGVFDLLHQEHLFFLQQARRAGDVLVVGIESDRRVRQLKGAGRPINDQATRRRRIGALEVVEVAFILPEKFTQPAEHLALLELIRPQILAVSSHSPHLAQKRLLMQQVGGEVRVVHQHNPAVSTTKLLS